MRDYDASSSIWTTADSYRGSLAQPSTLHRYGFVNANPVNGWDAYGWCVERGSGGSRRENGDAPYGRDCEVTPTPAVFPKSTSPFAPPPPTQTATQTQIPTPTSTKIPTQTQTQTATQTQIPPTPAPVTPTSPFVVSTQSPTPTATNTATSTSTASPLPVTPVTSTPILPTPTPSETPILPYCTYACPVTPTPTPNEFSTFSGITIRDITNVVTMDNSVKIIYNPTTGQTLNISVSGISNEQYVRLDNIAEAYERSLSDLASIAQEITSSYNASNNIALSASLILVSLIATGLGGLPTGAAAVASFIIGTGLTLKDILALGTDVVNFLNGQQTNLRDQYITALKNFQNNWGTCESFVRPVTKPAGQKPL